MSEASDLFLIDTNILIYAIDLANQRKHKIAGELLDKCWKRETMYAVSSQNLAEFFVATTKKLPLPVEQAEQIINDISTFSHWRILSYNAKILQNAIELHKLSRKHFWDAMIVATMLENNITHIYTENDKDFSGYEGITVVNPFA